jgi:speckle-type POZ protein
MENALNYRYLIPKLLQMELIEGNFPHELDRYFDEDELCSNFDDLYYSEDFSDFKVICSSGEVFPVHRCILAVNSPVLKTMMLTDMQESIENVLEVNDIDGVIMNKILYFMYTQKISGVAEYLEGLIYGAEKYQIKNLKRVCFNHMFDNLCVENSVEFFMLACLYDIDRLKELCLMYIQM